MKTNNNPLTKHLLMAALAVGIAATAAAQTPPAGSPPPKSPMPADAHHGAPRDPAKMMEKFKEMQAKRQAMVHDKLKITAEQEPAWKTFTQSMTPAQPPMPPMREHKEGEHLSAPQQMEQGLTRMKEHEAQMEKHLSALKTFYAVLTPEQQKTFDDIQHHAMHKMHNMREKMHDRPGMNHPM